MTKIRDKITEAVFVAVSVAGIVLAVVVTIAGVLAVGLFPIWLTVSLGTSAVKAAVDDCGTTWKIELIVGGDWFCPEEESND